MDLADNILISGCGGGYDIFTGLPIYFEYMNINNIYLSNLSFTKEEYLEKFTKICDSLYEVNFSHCTIDKNIKFPEYYLSKELNKSIYCFIDKGLIKLRNAYGKLVEQLNIKTIILADGGCDSIMKGDEEELGTPVEDYMSMLCVYELYKNNIVDNIYLSCLGLDVDTYIEIKYDDLTKNLEDLAEYIIATKILDKNDVITQKYIDVFSKCQPKHSICNCCIVSSIEENYGNYHHKFLENKLNGEGLNIKFLTKCMIIFALDKVVERNTLIKNISDLDDSDNIDEFIMNRHVIL